MPITKRLTSQAFICYSHRDAELVNSLFQLLRSMGSVFMDTFNLMPGDEWRPELHDAIATCSVFFIFWCYHAAESEEVRREYQLALERKKRVVPVLLDITPLPPELRAFQWIDLSRHLSVHIGMARDHQEQGRFLRDLLFDDDLRGIDRRLLECACPS